MITPEIYTGAAIAANAIWNLLDERRYQDILPFLTSDCAWERTEGWRHGHDELIASFEARPADLFTRHLVTNFAVEQAGDGKLRGRCYIVAFAAKTQDHDATQLIDHPSIIGDLDLEFVRSGQHVLISKIAVHQAFAIQDLLK